MLSGFNTDVDRSGTVLHVQTEDKGLEVAVVESLVYLGGQILASRRTSYREVVDEGKGREAVLEVMDAQHRGLIDEINEGAFDDKLPQAGADAAPEEETHEFEVEPAAVTDTESESEPIAQPVEVGEQAPDEPAKGDEHPRRTPPPAPDPDQPLDEMVLDYLSNEESQEGLALTIEDETDLELGSEASVRIHCGTRHSKEPLSSVAITVKMISTVSEPVTLTEGLTDETGHLDLQFRVPNLRRGSGALIITGHCELGSADVKRLL